MFACVCVNDFLDDSREFILESCITLDKVVVLIVMIIIRLICETAFEYINEKLFEDQAVAEKIERHRQLFSVLATLTK
jgi:hypothetical protein